MRTMITPKYMTETVDLLYISKGGETMASQNKKKKAKNSYLSNGGEKLDGKNKRTMYYTKRQRKKLKEMEIE